MIRRLREPLRAQQGRAAQPSACIVDSQIVKCADTVPKHTSGYHGGKKITGRGRHVAVDVEGWLLAIVVTAASVSDRAGLKLLVIRLFDAVSTLKIMWADSGYDGAPLAAWVKAAAAITLEVVKRSQPALLPGRPPPLGRRADIRLADALPAAGPRLRAPHRASRGHGLLGDHPDHDQKARPLRNRPAPGQTLGRGPHASRTASQGST